jgi:cytidine deaminase
MSRDEDLLREAERAAREVSARAYAPYSGFRVGAAVVTASGRVIAGCNVENASYGLTICAERVAVFTAVAEGETEVRAVVVYTPTPTPTAPCGACRQVLHEFGPGAEVISVCDGAGRTHTALPALLPGAFGPVNLSSSPVGDSGNQPEKP